MTELSAHLFPDVYARAGIDLDRLGAVMLDTVPIDVMSFVPESFAEDLYTSPDPAKYWVKADVASKGAHLTLLYGIIEHRGWRTSAREVLSMWRPEPVETSGLTFFPDPSGGPFSAVVLKVEKTSHLLQGRARLELLPHINTFVEYKPHLTLAYVKKGREMAWIDELGNALSGHSFPIAHINYGGQI